MRASGGDAAAAEVDASLETLLVSGRTDGDDSRKYVFGLETGADFATSALLLILCS